MPRKEYSAGAVKFSFWFAEFRKVVSLLRSGKTMDEIKKLAGSDNIFSAATPMRSSQIWRTVSARVLALSDEHFELFEKSGLETQKLIALVAVMETDTLFFDFMNEVFREKLITGDMLLTDADIRVFFSNKQRDNEKAAMWTDGTLDRLRKCYKAYLSDAGLLTRSVGDRKIIKPLVDGKLSRLLSDTENALLLKILSGTR